MTATATSSTTVDLEWDTVAVDGGILEYRIYDFDFVNGTTLIGTTTNTTYTVTDLTPDTVFNFDVTAVSNYGRIESEPASTSVQTPA